MANVTESKIKVGFSVTKKEYEAMEFVQTIHGSKYEGVCSVLNDYSVAQCVEIHAKAKEEVA